MARITRSRRYTRGKRAKFRCSKQRFHAPLRETTRHKPKTLRDSDSLTSDLTQAADSEAAVLNFSFQRMRLVICITTNSVSTAPIVISSPVKPFRKNAYENITR